MYVWKDRQALAGSLSGVSWIRGFCFLKGNLEGFL